MTIWKQKEYLDPVWFFLAPARLSRSPHRWTRSSIYRRLWRCSCTTAVRAAHNTSGSRHHARLLASRCSHSTTIWEVYWPVRDCPHVQEYSRSQAWRSRGEGQLGAHQALPRIPANYIAVSSTSWTSAVETASWGNYVTALSPPYRRSAW